MALQLERVDLASADGAAATIHAHGAHVTSWRPAPGGEERLFLSSASEFGQGAAIRGGVPVIFPQFGLEGPLPRHGFARTLVWNVERADSNDAGSSVAVFSLTDSDSTREIWPHAFRAELSVRVGGASLAVALSIENTDEQNFSFHAALHTYFRVHDITQTEVVGLHGTRYRVSGPERDLHFDDDEILRLSGETDRIYVGAPRNILLREPDRELSIVSDGFPDAVIWNPGARAASIPDMEPGGERHMICIEAAAVQEPIELAPGRKWTGTQSFAAEVRDLLVH